MVAGLGVGEGVQGPWYSLLLCLGLRGTVHQETPVIIQLFLLSIVSTKEFRIGLGPFDPMQSCAGGNCFLYC